MLRGICLDIAGVLTEGRHLIPGAQDALKAIRAAQLPCRLLTNTSRRPASAIHRELETLGLAVARDEVLTAPQAVADYLRHHQLRPWLLVHPAIACEFEGIDTDNPNAVVICDAEDLLNYANLDQAFSLLMAGAPLLGVGMNRYFSADKRLHLDAGPFIKALEFAAGVKAEIIGKPGRQMFLSACEAMAIDPAHCLMLGDDVHADVQGALDAGLQAGLVRTGKFRDGDAEIAQKSGAGVFADVLAAVRAALAVVAKPQ